jgi:hypothetical protein
MMAKMLSKTSGLIHPGKIARGAITNIGDDFAALRYMMVPAKFRLVSAVIMVATTAMTIIEEMSSDAIIEMRKTPAGRVIDPDIHVHIICHPKKS